MELMMFFKDFKKWCVVGFLIFIINPVFAEPEQPSKEGEITRSLFTSSVQNHEPIDQLTILSDLISEAFYFTEFRNYQGRTLKHQWSHNGKVSHSISFTINGKRWRVHSSKSFISGTKQEGTWVVKILDENGSVLHTDSIDYIRASTQAEIDAAEAAAEKAAQEQEEKSTEITSNKNTADDIQAQEEPTKSNSEVDTKSVKANTDNTVTTESEKQEDSTKSDDKTRSESETKQLTTESEKTVEPKKEKSSKTEGDSAKPKSDSESKKEVSDGETSPTSEEPGDKNTDEQTTQEDAEPKSKDQTTEKDNANKTDSKSSDEESTKSSDKPIWEKL